MLRYRNKLPQLAGGVFLTDAGLETDLMFNHNIDIPHFAAHALLDNVSTRRSVQNYFRGYLQLACEHETGFILDSQTWKAHMHWAQDLAMSETELKQSNLDAVQLISGLRDEYSANSKPIILNGLIGPRGDGYAPEAALGADEAQTYHAKQIGWLAETEVDMVTALTFTQSGEAIGAVRAARSVGLPIVVSFTVETDARLPTGQTLKSAIEAVDAATDQAAAYFMVNCAHPEHFDHVLEDADWARRIRGVRCNASRLSHAELDACETLDDGDPDELAGQYMAITSVMPWLNIFGGCCGADLRHVTAIAHALARETAEA
jgi:S-methylmethionine-dependent homocysteine/selenocysteine methylase